MSRTHIPKLISQIAWGAGLALAGVGIAQAQSLCSEVRQAYSYSDNNSPDIDRTYTVPSTGYYWIEAAGAEGNDRNPSGFNNDVEGGRGAIVSGTFHLEEDSSLNVRVGRKPTSDGGGGGGGSFVALTGESTPTFLLVAGGGGGGQTNDSDFTSKHGQAPTANGAGGAGITGAGGVDGAGGTRTATRGAAAGGGINSNGDDGQSRSSPIDDSGGESWASGSAGGSHSNNAYEGGYGGGGAGAGDGSNNFNGGGGGGGGYSGGGSGGGGGGSFNASTLSAGFLTGPDDGRENSGQVRICTTVAVIPFVAPAAPSTAITGAVYSVTTLAASGGVGPYTYTWTSSGPTGMELTSAGVLTGTPAAAQVGSYSITVTDNSYPLKNETTVSLAVQDPPLVIGTTGTLPPATQGVNYTTTLQATGGTGNYSWSTSDLPPGLSLAGNRITGEPTQLGTYTITLTLSDEVSPTSVASKAVLEETVTLTVNAAAPAAPASAVPVPTLGEWSIALLAALVAGFGLRQHRRKQRA